MKRAARLELTAGFFQLHTLANNVDDVGTGDKVVDEILGNQSSHTEINGSSVAPGLPVRNLISIVVVAQGASQEPLLAEPGLHLGANGAHIRATGGLRLDLSHDLAHVADALGASGADCFLDHRVEFFF